MRQRPPARNAPTAPVKMNRRPAAPPARGGPRIVVRWQPLRPPHVEGASCDCSACAGAIATAAGAASTHDTSAQGAAPPDERAASGAEATESYEGAPAPARWVLPAAVRAAGERQHVAYDPAPAWEGGRNCGGALLKGPARLRSFLRSRAPGVGAIGGYNCRPNTANASRTSVHGSGRALDIMIPPVRGAANASVGDPIANWLVQNASAIGVQYIIWNRVKWSGARRGRKDSAYGGPNPHIDHIHVELNDAGARAATPWFQSTANEVTSAGELPPVDVVSVQGIAVARGVAPKVSALLDAARAAGFPLKGSGYRSSARQIALRKRHCGSSEYDIWQKPASQCVPPTARPGRSLHERGLALDLRLADDTRLTRNSPAFQWLSQNAGRFGFYNLPSEPWHWSVSGK